LNATSRCQPQLWGSSRNCVDRWFSTDRQPLFAALSVKRLWMAAQNIRVERPRSRAPPVLAQRAVPLIAHLDRSSSSVLIVSDHLIAQVSWVQYAFFSRLYQACFTADSRFLARPDSYGRTTCVVLLDCSTSGYLKLSPPTMSFQQRTNVENVMTSVFHAHPTCIGTCVHAKVPHQAKVLPTRRFVRKCA
jgi:hypothetical protein